VKLILACTAIFASVAMAGPAPCRAGLESSARLRTMMATANSIRDFEKYANTRYDFKALGYLKRLEKLNPEFNVLVVDPGLLLRMDQFENFVSDNNLRDSDPWTVRQLFSASLGTRVVYRALSLDYTEYRNTQKVGMDSAALRSGVDQASLVNLFSNTLEFQINRRVSPRGENRQDTLLSVSESPEIAVSAVVQNRTGTVGQLMMSGDPLAAMTSFWTQAAKQIYVFKVNMPEIDLIFRDEKSDLLPQSNWSSRTQIQVATLGGLVSKTMGDRAVESFVLLKIERSEIEWSRPALPTELSFGPGFFAPRP
jgi:hypothetical protein